MTNCLRRLASVCVPLTRFACVSVTRSTIRITAVAVAAVAVFALISANAQNKLKLRDAYVNEKYSFSFKDAVRGEGENAVWISGEGLPPGMMLSRDGALEGIPTKFKEYTFDVSAQVDGDETFRTSVTIRVLPAGFDNGQLDTAGASATTTLPETFKNKTCGTPQKTDFVLASSTADEETIALTEDANDEALGAINQGTLAITDINKLILNTLGNNRDKVPVPDQFKKGDYTIVHIVKWKQFKPDSDKTDPERELWALYELVEDSGKLVWTPRMNPDNDEIFDTRIFGSRRVAILLLHLRTPRTWDVKYKIDVNRRIPQPIQNALALAPFIGGTGKADAICDPPPLRNIWGGRLMLPRHLPSDVIVKLNTVTANNEGQQISQSKEYSKSYLNEGRYHWDVSVGMPVVSIKELEFTSEDGVVTAKKKERQNAYGFLNLFPRAVDLNAKSFLTSPHLVLGVPISGKPLDRPVVALGTGLYTDFLKINFFAGVAFNKVREPRTLNAGDAATTGQLESDLQSRREKKFIFGINFPIRQFLDAVKDK